MIFFGKPDVSPAPPWWPDEPLVDIQPTRGRPIDHIAFSYRDIEPVFARMKAAEVEIVEPITMHDEIKTRSFTVLRRSG